MPHGAPEALFFARLEEACQAIRLYAPDVLVFSLGFDIYENDPQAKVSVTTEGFSRLGQAIDALNLPTLVVQEGGYALDALEKNARAFFLGLLGR